MLLPFGSATVKAAELKSPREIALTLDRPAPEGIALGKDVVENATWTPEVEIRGCSFSRIPTRGIMLSTRRKTVIEDNTFTLGPGPAVSALLTDGLTCDGNIFLTRDSRTVENLIQARNCTRVEIKDNVVRPPE